MINCIRCGLEIPSDTQTFSEMFVAGDGLSGMMILSNGVNGVLQVMRHNQAIGCYCAECSKTLRYCRICGCTYERACEGGCYWSEVNLCSTCAPPGQKATWCDMA